MEGESSSATLSSSLTNLGGPSPKARVHFPQLARKLQKWSLLLPLQAKFFQCQALHTKLLLLEHKIPKEPFQVSLQIPWDQHHLEEATKGAFSSFITDTMGSTSS
nr:hypothetical protein Iba_chr13dCG7160 [Ipomoea batatas]